MGVEHPFSLAQIAAAQGLGPGPFGTPAITDAAKLGGLLGGFLIPEQLAFEEKWFNKKSIELDGYRFVRCRFDGCELIIRSGNISIDQCLFNECSFVFEGAAAVIAQMDELARRLSPKARELTAQYQADVTISVP